MIRKFVSFAILIILLGSLSAFSQSNVTFRSDKSIYKIGDQAALIAKFPNFTNLQPGEIVTYGAQFNHRYVDIYKSSQNEAASITPVITSFPDSSTIQSDSDFVWEVVAYAENPTEASPLENSCEEIREFLSAHKSRLNQAKTLAEISKYRQLVRREEDNLNEAMDKLASLRRPLFQGKYKLNVMLFGFDPVGVLPTPPIKVQLSSPDGVYHIGEIIKLNVDILNKVSGIDAPYHQVVTSGMGNYFWGYYGLDRKEQPSYLIDTTYTLKKRDLGAHELWVQLSSYAESQASFLNELPVPSLGGSLSNYLLIRSLRPIYRQVLGVQIVE